MADLGAPVRVSPLIKFSRWSFLGLGILYGAFHQRRLTKKENILREIEAKKKVERDAKLAIEKKLAFEKQMRELEDIMAGKK